MSRRHLSLLGDKLEVRQNFREKSKYITAIKLWHIKNSL
jgi:hypothetical protein